jgi:hypothetical protein
MVVFVFFFQYLAAGVLPVELPTPCICLGDLSFCINFNNLKEISAALCLLRSSPNLQKLEISVSTYYLVLFDLALLAGLWLRSCSCTCDLYLSYVYYLFSSDQ